MAVISFTVQGKSKVVAYANDQNAIEKVESSYGHPVVGDPAYLADGSHGDQQTLDLGDPPLCLHAWKLSFDHPVDGRRMEFTDDRPDWAAGADVTS